MLHELRDVRRKKKRFCPTKIGEKKTNSQLVRLCFKAEEYLFRQELNSERCPCALSNACARSFTLGSLNGLGGGGSQGAVLTDKTRIHRFHAVFYGPR